MARRYAVLLYLKRQGKGTLEALDVAWRSAYSHERWVDVSKYFILTYLHFCRRKWLMRVYFLPYKCWHWKFRILRHFWDVNNCRLNNIPNVIKIVSQFSKATYPNRNTKAIHLITLSRTWTVFHFRSNNYIIHDSSYPNAREITFLIVKPLICDE